MHSHVCARNLHSSALTGSWDRMGRGGISPFLSLSEMCSPHKHYLFEMVGFLFFFLLAYFWGVVADAAVLRMSLTV